MIRVDWNEAALEQLAAVYLAIPAGLREELTRTCDDVERRLQRNGENEGESRSANIRVLIHELLVVKFTLQPSGAVEIVDVRPNRSVRG